MKPRRPLSDCIEFDRHPRRLAVLRSPIVWVPLLGALLIFTVYRLLR